LNALLDLGLQLATIATKAENEKRNSPAPGEHCENTFLKYPNKKKVILKPSLNVLATFICMKRIFFLTFGRIQIALINLLET